MGGKGSSGGPSQAEINQQAYSAGAGGAKWVDIDDQIPYGHESALQSWMAGQQSAQQQYHMPSFHMPEMAHEPSFHQPQQQMQQGPTYAEQMAEQQRLQAEAEARAARIAGENQRDSLYSAYMDAAGSATDYINSEIEQEMANAKLLGIDYELTDDMKSTRISDYFATVWGEGEQKQLEGLMDKWGKPQGFEGFTITRGDGSSYGGTTSGEEGVATSSGVKPTILAEEDEDVLGASANAPTILGA